MTTQYTLGTAAKACGVGRSTVFRAIKSGKISAGLDENGRYTIEPAELHRVFPPVSEKQTEQQALGRYAMSSETIEAAVLQAKIEGLQALLEREQETTKDLRHRLDQSEEERRQTQTKLTALLTHQASPQPETTQTAPVPKSFWQKLLDM